MPRGNLLTDYQRGQIDTLASQGTSHRKIAAEIGKSRTVVLNYLHKGESYGTKRFHGRKNKLDNRTRRRILRDISNTSKSARQIQTELTLPVTPQTIRNVVREKGTVKFTKMKKKPAINIKNKNRRLDWCKDKVGWGPQWTRAVYTDEKKFNLDGPDGYRYYWHDLRKEEKIFSKHHSGIGSVMIWGGFSGKGKTPLAFISPCSTAIDYQEVLETYLKPVWKKIGGRNFVFIQDNAPIHKAKTTMQWFEERNIEVLELCPVSPDLNLIENVWGWLARKVYAEGRQFSLVSDLKTAIETAWNEISQSYLNSLIDSMPHRIAEVIYNHGGPSKY